VVVVAVAVLFQEFHVETESYVRTEPDLMMRQIRADAPRTAPPVALQVSASTIEAPPPERPAPVASSVVQAPVDRDRAELAELVASFFPDAPIFSEHIVWAESMGDWAGDRWTCYVYGPCVSPTGDRGLMQINQIHAGRFAAHGWDYWTDAFDPVKNLTVAREIYDDQGCRAWASC